MSALGSSRAPGADSRHRVVIASVRVEAALRRRVRGPLDVVWTDNRSTLATARRRGGRTMLRVSRRLLGDATDPGLPEAMGDALVAFLRGHPDGRRWLRQRAQDAFAVLGGPCPPRRRPVRVGQARGETHDLARLLAAEIARPGAFSPEELQKIQHVLPPVRIGWARWSGRRRPPARLQLGSYRPDAHVVRVHPLLDHADVPGWYVGVVIHHELLHHVLATTGHPTAFRARERRHPRFSDAERFEAAQLPRHTRRAWPRRGTP